MTVVISDRFSSGLPWAGRDQVVAAVDHRIIVIGKYVAVGIMRVIEFIQRRLGGIGKGKGGALWSQRRGKSYITFVLQIKIVISIVFLSIW